MAGPAPWSSRSSYSSLAVEALGASGVAGVVGGGLLDPGMPMTVHACAVHGQVQKSTKTSAV